MGGRSDVIEKIKEKFQNLFKHGAHKEKWKYITAILLTGVLLIFVSNMLQPRRPNTFEIAEDKEVTRNHEGEEDDFIDDVEEKEVHNEKTLQAILNENSGVSEVETM